MKKLFKVTTAVVVMAAVILISTKPFSSQKKLDDLFCENVEAPADAEGINSYTCETTIKAGNSFVYYCAICDWVPNSAEALFSSTKTCTK